MEIVTITGYPVHSTVCLDYWITMREFLLVLSTVCFLGAEISAQKKVKELFSKDDISILLAYFFIDTYCIISCKLCIE